jgi:hypothetical protein
LFAIKGPIPICKAISFYESLGFTLGSLVPNNGGGFPDMVEIDCMMVNDAMLEKSF